MKIFSIIIFAFLTIVYSISSSIGGPIEEYVYVVKIENGKVFKTTDKKEKQEVRRMELIQLGMMLEIEKGASIYLTCPGYKILMLDHEKSPYRVNIADFLSEESRIGELLGYFKEALMHYVFPGSEEGRRIPVVVRGKRCNLWPKDKERIIPLGEYITFKWKLNEGTVFSIREINQDATDREIYIVETKANFINIPVENFKAGKRYKWTLLAEGGAIKCESTFTLLSEDESKRINAILQKIPVLYPYRDDGETICRLQAGYLSSENLEYSARQWLERNKLLHE